MYNFKNLICVYEFHWILCETIVDLLLLVFFTIIFLLVKMIK